MVDGLDKTITPYNIGALPTPAQTKAHTEAHTEAHKDSRKAESSRFDALLYKANHRTSHEQELGTDSPPPKSAGDDAQLRWTAQQLEVIFLKELFAGMRRTVPEGGLFSNSFSMRTYQDMLDAEQAKALAQGSGMGIADVVLRQLKG